MISFPFVTFKYSDASNVVGSATVSDELPVLSVKIGREMVGDEKEYVNYKVGTSRKFRYVVDVEFAPLSTDSTNSDLLGLYDFEQVFYNVVNKRFVWVNECSLPKFDLVAYADVLPLQVEMTGISDSQNKESGITNITATFKSTNLV